MSSEPALSYLLTRTALGLGLAAGVVALARWAADPDPNTSSIAPSTPGPRG